MSQSIIVVGPAGCGKTINGEALKRHFGLQWVLDLGLDLHPVQRLPAKNTLILAQEQDVPSEHSCRVVPFHDAMRQMRSRP